MIEAIRSGEFETIMMSYSAIDQEGVGKTVLPLALEHGLGVIVMKPLMEGDLTTPGSGGGNLAGFHGLPGRRVLKGDPLVATGLKFILSNPAVSTIIPGMTSIEEIEENVRPSDIVSPIARAGRRDGSTRRSEGQEALQPIWSSLPSLWALFSVSGAD